MKRILIVTGGLLSLLGMGFLTSCETTTDPPQTNEVVDCSVTTPTYDAEIRSIVQGNCATPGCHVAGFSAGDFSNFEGIKAVANSGSLRANVVTSRAMPPGRPLSQDDIDQIDCWIQNGAPEN